MRAFLLSLAMFAFMAALGYADAPKRVLLIAQGPDGHPPQTHEYVAGLKILKRCLQPIEGIELGLVRADEPFAEGPELIDRADGVVLFLCEGGKWMQHDEKRFAALKRLVQRGGGVVGLHWGIGTKDAKYIEGCLSILGGCHGGPDRKYQVVETTFAPVADHPIAVGVSAFKVKEEFYYRLKFSKAGVVKPVAKARIDGEDETVAWAWERPDGGRSFGFTGLHFHDNWKHADYRRLVAQGVLWSLKLPIPKTGLSADVPADELQLKR